MLSFREQQSKGANNNSQKSLVIKGLSSLFYRDDLRAQFAHFFN